MFLTMSQLGDTLKGVVEISKGAVRVLNAKQTQGPLCTQLLETATEHQQIEMRGMARWLLKMLASSFGIHLQSLELKYVLPRIQIQKINDESACAIFRSAKRQKITAFIIKVASQSTASFSAFLIAGAIQTEYQGTLFFEETDKENEGLIVGEREELPGRLESDLDQYFKKYKQTDSIHQSLKAKKIYFSLKDELALAGMESKPEQHHTLFSSQE